jgi:hypothetical protein
MKGNRREGRRAGSDRRRARPQVRRRWVEADLETLARLYRTHSNAHIAKLLRRSVGAVVFKAHQLGLFKGVRRLRQMGRENIRLRWKGRPRRRRE